MARAGAVRGERSASPRRSLARSLGIGFRIRGWGGPRCGSWFDPGCADFALDWLALGLDAVVGLLCGCGRSELLRSGLIVALGSCVSLRGSEDLRKEPGSNFLPIWRCWCSKIAH